MNPIRKEYRRRRTIRRQIELCNAVLEGGCDYPGRVKAWRDALALDLAKTPNQDVLNLEATK